MADKKIWAMSLHDQKQLGWTYVALGREKRKYLLFSAFFFPVIYNFEQLESMFNTINYNSPI